MRMIEHLEDQITEEIEGAEDYAKCALAKREEYPDLAKVYYDLANDELEHVKMLHSYIVKFIRDYRDKKGEPPADMLAVYEYLHKKQIEQVNGIQLMLDTFRDR